MNPVRKRTEPRVTLPSVPTEHPHPAKGVFRPWARRRATRRAHPWRGEDGRPRPGEFHRASRPSQSPTAADRRPRVPQADTMRISPFSAPGDNSRASHTTGDPSNLEKGSAQFVLDVLDSPTIRARTNVKNPGRLMSGFSETDPGATVRDRACCLVLPGVRRDAPCPPSWTRACPPDPAKSWSASTASWSSAGPAPEPNQELAQA